MSRLGRPVRIFIPLRVTIPAIRPNPPVRRWTLLPSFFQVEATLRDDQFSGIAVFILGLIILFCLFAMVTVRIFVVCLFVCVSLPTFRSIFVMPLTSLSVICILVVVVVLENQFLLLPINIQLSFHSQTIQQTTTTQ
mmetsp:Transcript_4258/g.4534  ORF Transcript_4258/g.4534 Transcript_4258/m.4534 type:complete len:137 (-) Transcript_4258:40-450(-)